MKKSACIVSSAVMAGVAAGQEPYVEKWDVFEQMEDDSERLRYRRGLRSIRP